MQKPSPNYRSDEHEALPEEIKKYLDQHFLNKLDNLKTPNPRVLVVFSGGNALGKSTLSNKIKQECKALVLENDMIKASLFKLKPNISREELNTLTWKYSMDLYSRLNGLTPNGLIVRDAVIDWYFDRILP